MSKFTKKPVTVEAFIWTGDADQEEDPEWICERIRKGDVWFERDANDKLEMIIETLEGSMRAIPGDYIIRGVAGEVYPCKPGIFAATYEPADAC